MAGSKEPGNKGLRSCLLSLLKGSLGLMPLLLLLPDGWPVLGGGHDLGRVQQEDDSNLRAVLGASRQDRRGAAVVHLQEAQPA